MIAIKTVDNTKVAIKIVIISVYLRNYKERNGVNLRMNLQFIRHSKTLKGFRTLMDFSLKENIILWPWIYLA